MANQTQKLADPILIMVCNAVQHHMVNDGHRPELSPLPKNVETVTCYAVDSSTTRVKVYTTDQGVRAFTIKLTEDDRQ